MADTDPWAVVDLVPLGVAVFGQEPPCVIYLNPAAQQLVERLGLPPRPLAPDAPVGETVLLRLGEADVRLIAVRRFGLRWADNSSDSTIVELWDDVTEAESHRLLCQEIASALSHDVRGTIGSAAISVGAVLDGVAGDVPGHAARHLRNAGLSAQQAVWIVENVVDVLRGGLTSRHLQLTATAVDELVEEALVFARRRAVEANIQLTVDLSSAPDKVICDRGRVARALHTLAVAGVDWAPRGAAVVVKAWRDDVAEAAYLVLSVRSHILQGAAELPRLFSPVLTEDDLAGISPFGRWFSFQYVRMVAEAHGGRAWSEAEGRAVKLNVAVKLE